MYPEPIQTNHNEDYMAVVTSEEALWQDVSFLSRLKMEHQKFHIGTLMTMRMMEVCMLRSSLYMSIVQFHILMQSFAIDIYFHESRWL